MTNKMLNELKANVKLAKTVTITKYVVVTIIIISMLIISAWKW